MREAFEDLGAFEPEMTKAAVAAGTTTDAAWAAPLAPRTTVAPILSAVQRESLLGRIAGLRPVPFRGKVPTQDLSASYQWTGEGKPKPASKLGFSSQSMSAGKIMRSCAGRSAKSRGKSNGRPSEPSACRSTFSTIVSIRSARHFGRAGVRRSGVLMAGVEYRGAACVGRRESVSLAHLDSPAFAVVPD